MAITGKVREKSEYSKKTGFGEYKVISVNPNREELEKLLGTSIERDIEYLGEDVDSKATKLNLVFWLEEVESSEKRSIRFYLKDAIRENKTKTTTQYINGSGLASWASSPETLMEWFIKQGGVRKAHDGEEEFYNFCRAWLSKLDTREGGELVFDWVKLMKGNVSELKAQIGGVYEDTVVCLSTIKTVVKDNETKEYEQIYNKESLPGYVMKKLRLTKIDQTYIDNANNTESKKRGPLQKFVLSVIDPEYGIKDYYTLGILEDYDPKKNIAASDKSHINADDTSY